MRQCQVCAASIDHKRQQAIFCSQGCCNYASNKAWCERNPEQKRLRDLKWTELRRTRRTYGSSIREQARAMGFRSGFERTLAASLGKRKMKFGYETVKLPYSIHHVYSPDFVLPNGILIEAKGKLTPQDRTKMIAVKKHHPDLDIRFVFMRGANTLTAKSKLTYMAWAERNGFPAADGEIPDEWLT